MRFAHVLQLLSPESELHGREHTNAMRIRYILKSALLALAGERKARIAKIVCQYWKDFLWRGTLHFRGNHRKIRTGVGA